MLKLGPNKSILSSSNTGSPKSTVSIIGSTISSTILNDNPRMNCRLNGLEKFSPIVVVIDKNLKIKVNSLC